MGVSFWNDDMLKGLAVIDEEALLFDKMIQIDIILKTGLSSVLYDIFNDFYIEEDGDSLTIIGRYNRLVIRKSDIAMIKYSIVRRVVQANEGRSSEGFDEGTEQESSGKEHS